MFEYSDSMMLGVAALVTAFYILRAVWMAYQLGRQTDDPMWTVRAVALLEPVVSSAAGVTFLYWAWHISPWFAPMIIVHPLIFNIIVRHLGRDNAESKEFARDMFIRAALVIPAALGMFITGKDYINSLTPVCGGILLLAVAAIMTFTFTARQSLLINQAYQQLKQSSHTSQSVLPSEQDAEKDVHDWSTDETMLQQLKEKEKVEIDLHEK